MFILLAILFPLALFASPSEDLLQKLIAQAWSPQNVRVEWSFSDRVPQKLNKHTDWILAEPKPSRMAGSLILKLRRKSDSDSDEFLTVSGRARIFGNSLTVKKQVMAGRSVKSANLGSAELEWTQLQSPALNTDLPTRPFIAVHALVPGRPLTTDDLKPAPTVHRDQKVNLVYVQGGVKLTLTGRALQSGAIGDIIPVSVDMGKEKRFKGTIQPDGIVQLIL